MVIALALVIFFICFLSFLPIVNWEHWTVRIWDYPCKQFLVALSTSLVLFFSIHHQLDWLFLAVLVSGICAEALLIHKIYPYTSLAKKQLPNSNASKKDISLLISNVLMENDNYLKLKELLFEKNADIIMLIETDSTWESALKDLEKDYPFCHHHPLPNTYGILIYSKFPLQNAQYRFITSESIPSFQANLELPNGKTINFYGLHPEPPFPTISTTTARRDAEILKVGREIKDSDQPTIVAGDLNDVAWSYTTQLFQKESRMLDPRKGRGFFSTFHADHFWARWPLDHVFVSKHFELVKMERLRNIGSDHFPIYIELNLVEQHEAKMPNSPTEEDKKVIEKKLDQVDLIDKSA